MSDCRCCSERGQQERCSRRSMRPLGLCQDGGLPVAGGLMAALPREVPVLYVLAGVNGAGKSSIGGALLRSRSLDYFNPDECAREVRQVTGRSIEQSMVDAGHEGRRRLEKAIAMRANQASETHLADTAIPALIQAASNRGYRVLVAFYGLSHPRTAPRARVAARAAAGGHATPLETIQSRWMQSRENLVALLSVVSELRVFDNSVERDALSGLTPPPKLVLHVRDGRLVVPGPDALAATPDWAKPLVQAAMSITSRPAAQPDDPARLGVNEAFYRLN